MNAVEILAALNLPAAARVNRRVPKTLLHEHGAPTAYDKCQISDGIAQLLWVAALKPATIGVTEYRDDVREYLEIAVLHLKLRVATRTRRLVELVHRAVPYPLLLAAEQGERAQLSLGHKRWSQGEAGKTVLDGEVISAEWNRVGEDPHDATFLAALALGQQPRVSMYALYQGWVDTVLALQAARRTGVFAPPGSPDSAATRREALQECARLEAEIARLRSAAAKEKQMARQLELTLELKRVEAAKAEALARL